MTTGKRHVVEAPHFLERRVPCNKGGRHHRHKYCVEAYVPALCGTEVVEGQHVFNNFELLLHLGPGKNWCRKCLEVASKDPHRAGRMKETGFRDIH